MAKEIERVDEWVHAHLDDRQIADRLLTLTYLDGSKIITPKRWDIVLEVVAMFKEYPSEVIFSFLSTATNPEYIIWEQPAMDIGRIAVDREIILQQLEVQGVEGVEKCNFCSSNRVVIQTLQIRGGDEPMTIYCCCVECGRRWHK